MRAIVPGMVVCLALPACMDAGRLRGDTIVETLSGRSVVYDPPGPDLPPERETWRADGTRSATQRGIFHRDWLQRYEGVWWVDGDLYCAARERSGNESRWLCYEVTRRGDRITFEPYRRVLAFVPDLRRTLHGRLRD
ncbi:MAG: hypothetical protein HLUCCA12_06485 [Rhodobacteraceae bacterium HLUCCA12]|nr:MAG: hypothetical protein HLUCCA12_06485 [Rhodobacteraceae bacterium HLUCCA12]